MLLPPDPHDALDLPDFSRLPTMLALRRWSRGLAKAELLADLPTGGPYSLVAPIDAAFDRLPWSFERLLNDGRLVEPLVDLFEYCAVRGTSTGQSPLQRMRTLHGESIHIGDGLVIGPGNTARIVASLRVAGFTIHATDGCVLPSAVLAALSR